MPKQRIARHSVTQPLDTSYRLIPLTKGQNTVVDAEDFAWLSSFNWRAQWDCTTNSFYALTGRMSSTISMHRMILSCKENEQGDHRNHDTLDNRRSNLRKCSPCQNAQNRKIHLNNTSGCRGVNWHLGKWQARISVSGKRICLGHFPEKSDALEAYKRASSEHHQDFAYSQSILHRPPTI